MLFGKKVQKFWEHIKKLYRSLIYSSRAFIWYKLQFCALRIILLPLTLQDNSLGAFRKASRTKNINYLT